MKQYLSLYAAAALIASTATGYAENGPGVTDSSILLGQTVVYSGPASAWGLAGKVMGAYLEEINAKGGINGRKVEMRSLDDSCTPAKTVEATRRLVEIDKVFAMVGSTCTGSQAAVQKYLNDNKVPQLFSTGSGVSMYDAANFPWTVSFNFSYELEGEQYGRYVAEHKPGAKVGILIQNDDVGRALVRGFERGLGDKGTIVKKLTYETTDPTVDSQVIEIKSSGADTFANFAVLKYAAMSLRKARDLDWKPLHLIMNSSSSIPGVLEKAGSLDGFKGLVTVAWYKNPSDPKWASDPANLEFIEFMKRNFPGHPSDDAIAVHAYMIAEISAKTLEKAKNDLTRENLMAVVNSITNEKLSMLLPEIELNVSADNHNAIRKAGMSEFDGSRWALID